MSDSQALSSLLVCVAVFLLSALGHLSLEGVSGSLDVSSIGFVLRFLLYVYNICLCSVFVLTDHLSLG